MLNPNIPPRSNAACTPTDPSPAYITTDPASPPSPTGTNPGDSDAKPYAVLAADGVAFVKAYAGKVDLSAPPPWELPPRPTVPSEGAKATTGDPVESLELLNKMEQFNAELELDDKAVTASRDLPATSSPSEPPVAVESSAHTPETRRDSPGGSRGDGPQRKTSVLGSALSSVRYAHSRPAPAIVKL